MIIIHNNNNNNNNNNNTSNNNDENNNKIIHHSFIIHPIFEWLLLTWKAVSLALDEKKTPRSLVLAFGRIPGDATEDVLSFVLMEVDVTPDMGVSKNSGTPKWMVYNGKPS